MSDDQTIPLPSHIHYELLLQLLERETMIAAHPHSPLQGQVRELIITLRKALSQQRQLEETCDHQGVSVEYYWSLNVPSGSDDDPSIG
ncbi:hypothetical protein XM38_047720 [Halomicronema hongdechloris C2206]|uniref:DUF5340 domain-containing protein n=1 Tax=Halomicronema hongdechloris C2206 TaxID=1641165 RepID=A0A1Z3HU28_9CYAN|nr:DUF5340 domain-containing protein [Halomicronema hongdechloris]ASC73799.1 hypothetical protein XM38_047720 [Halomicronema hongdechloris C2206]